MQQASIGKCVVGTLASALVLSALVGCAVGTSEADVGVSDLGVFIAEQGRVSE